MQQYTSEDQRLFLPGDTTHGHYQIELACDACHDPDGGINANSCTDCHQAELDAINDSHPGKKFRDPRNADMLQHIDATQCITCHTEHAPERTGEMGATVPKDFCFHCHENIGEERPTHAGLGFDTCATAGCHNYHNNTALYYEFLLKHADEPAYKEDPKVLANNPALLWLRNHKARAALELVDHDGPQGSDTKHVQEWHRSAHARAGINCTDCHNDEQCLWQDTVALSSCAQCHQEEYTGWSESMHGMRHAAGLSLMTPEQARLPMHANAAHAGLDCMSCHTDHEYDTQYAAVDACMQCHNDEHTQNYIGSPHHDLWLKEQRGEASAQSGVSCATCHMPRKEMKNAIGESFVFVDHNVNATLTPNENMIRTSCNHCHGVGMSIDALADPELIKNNFSQQPAKHIQSIDWVLDHHQRTSK